jgi:outer membrane receptor protein involved in Fe transport
MGASAAVLSAFAVPAFAQQQTAQQGGTVIEELVVTAQKREEALQDVPIAVSAFSQDSLEAQKIDGGPNLQQAIPNVSFARSNFTNSFNFQIRGIGAKAVGASADQGVGVHMNNAPMQSGNLFEAEFYDVERVEVLRGPQGTLYGRNATGGVVNVITAKPTDVFEANARAEYGNFNAIRLRGMLNVPIFEDKLAVRLSGAMLKRDGFVTNTFNGHTVDDRDLYSTRVQVMFNPTEKLRTNFLWERFHENDSRARTGKQLCTKDNGPATVGGVPTGAARGFLTQGCLPASIYGASAYGTVNTSGTLTGLLGNIFGFTAGDANLGDTTTTNLREIETALDPIYRSGSNVYQFTLNYDLSDTLTFTSMTAYSKGSVYTKQDYNRNVSPVPFNNTPFTPGGFFNDPQVGNTNKFTTIDVSSGRSEQFSQELRLQSAFDGPINFNFGGIHFTYRTLTDYYVIGNSLTLSSLALNFSNTGNPNCNPATTARCIGIDTASDPTGDGHNYYLNRTPYTLVSDALFGEVYYQVNEDLKFTLGLRQTRDKKAVKNFSTVLLAPGYGLTLNPANPDQRARFNETTGRFGVDYKAHLGFTDDTLLYAFYSKGYKGGGINPGVPANSVGIRQTFDPEFVNAFEIGTKNTLMGGSLLFNATGFSYDYKGYQISKIVNRTSVNENVDAKVYGLELETIWSPVRNLKLNANLGYLHTKIGSGVTSIDTMNRRRHDPGRRRGRHPALGLLGRGGLSSVPVRPGRGRRRGPAGGHRRLPGQRHRALHLWLGLFDRRDGGGPVGQRAAQLAALDRFDRGPIHLRAVGRLVGHGSRRLLPPDQAVRPGLQHRVRPPEGLGQRQPDPEGREARVGPVDRRLRQEHRQQAAHRRRLHHRRQLGPVHQRDHRRAAPLRDRDHQVLVASTL